MAGHYSGCYVRTTVSGDSSDHTLASDSHLHTCLAGTRGVIILLHSRQHGANVRASLNLGAAQNLAMYPGGPKRTVLLPSDFVYPLFR